MAKMIKMFGAPFYAVKVFDCEDPSKSYPVIEIKREKKFFTIDANIFIAMAYSNAVVKKNSDNPEFRIYDNMKNSCLVFVYDYSEGVKAAYQYKGEIYNVVFDDLMIQTIRTVNEVMNEYRSKTKDMGDLRRNL